MDIKTIGTDPTGSEIKQLTLSNSHASLIFMSFGARIASWKLASGVNVLDPVINLDHARGKGRSHASIIAPVANRITDAEAEIDGIAYRLDVNEGENSLHSGTAGTQLRNWHLEEADEASVVFTIRHENGAGGLPGPCDFRVTYALSDNRLSLVIEAVAEVATLVNPAFHPYFLAPFRSTLKVNADCYLPVDDATLPTGQIRDVADTDFDLRKPVVPHEHFDHCLLLNDGIKELAAILATPTHRITVHTDAPGLQVFTGKEGLIALEPEIHPDAPSNPDFPSIILRPGEVYRQTSHWIVDPL